MIENIFSMAGKVCLVTGGSTGLGSYMAQGFLEAGASRVYITARSEGVLIKKAKELSMVGEGECIPIIGDLSSIDGVEALAISLQEREKYLDVLVNNAGIGTGGPFSELKPETWDMTMDLNLKSPVFLTQKLRHLLGYKATSEEPSRVIFIASVAASYSIEGVLAYSTSKNAVEHVVPTLALALCEENILVNAVSPGRFFSEMTRGAWQDAESERYKAELARIPAHRYGDIKDIAGVAIMLCSRAGSYFTGEVLNLDGGHRLRH
tara:strand:+ start:510 stop:1301 length:792 start_codon:yes stop_codon:yes gene_type:complete